MTESTVGTGFAAAARCLALDQHAVLVSEAMTAAGIESMILKGPGLARRLYADDPGRRLYSDVDLLVAPTDFDRAEQVLADLGHLDVAGRFPRDAWLDHERSWLREHPVPLTVDLHRGFAGAGNPEALWRLLSASAEELQLSGRPVQVPDAVGCALLIGLHAAAPGRGRKALVDLTAALEQFPDAVWTAAGQAARLTSSETAFATGLGRLPAGADLVRRLQLAGRQTRIGRLAARFDLMLLDRSVVAVDAVPGRLAKLRYIGRRLVPTPEFLRRASPLAARGPLGLVLAYAVRPVRLLLPAPRPGTRPGFAVRLRRTARRLERLRHWRPADWRTALWVLRALPQVRADLSRQPLAEITISSPPRAAAPSRTAVEQVLAARRATCLERSLILQRWLATHGSPVEVVVGVSAPATGFHAHAWLTTDDDAAHNAATMAEIVRLGADAGISPAGAADQPRRAG